MSLSASKQSNLSLSSVISKRLYSRVLVLLVLEIELGIDVGIGIDIDLLIDISIDSP